MWIVHANWSRENRPPPGRWAAEPLLCYLKFCWYARRPFVSLYTILPPSISFPLFIYFQFHHLPHLFPPMFIMCLAVCVVMLIISLLSFRLYSYIYNDLSIYRVFWQPTCSTGPRVEESSNSHILPKLFLYIVAIVDLFVCFVLFTLALKSTWVFPGVVDIPRASTLYIIKYLAGDCVRLDVFVLLRKLWRNNIREKLPMIHSRSWCLYMTLLYFFLFWPCTVYIVLA